MEKPEIVTFNLYVQNGISLEDAVNVLESASKDVSILYKGPPSALVRCQTKTHTYELLSGTNLVKKVCEYKGDFPFYKEIQHEYYTTDRKPELCESLKPYFKSISTVGEHLHILNSF